MWVVCGSVGCELVAWLHSHMQGLSGLCVVCVCAGCELVSWLHSHVQVLSDGVYVGWFVSTWVVCGCAGCELVA